MVAAAIRPIFNAETGEEARRLLGETVARLERPLPKVAQLLVEAEEDLLAFYCFPASHRTKLRSTNPLERVNREIGRRTDVVGIFPNDAAPNAARTRRLERIAQNVRERGADRIGERPAGRRSTSAKPAKSRPPRGPAPGSAQLASQRLLTCPPAHPLGVPARMAHGRGSSVANP
jgi:hypothetical protein